MTGDADAVADAFVTTVALFSQKRDPVGAALLLGRAARTLHIKGELTPARRQRLTERLEDVKRAAREGRN